MAKVHKSFFYSTSRENLYLTVLHNIHNSFMFQGREIFSDQYWTCTWKEHARDRIYLMDKTIYKIP